MKRKNVTRSALFTSIISLLLCVSMLVGTTFAWFTDSVESGRNVIAAGNLDVELYNDDGQVTGSTKLFDDVNPNLWEPGAVAYENLQVKNVGTLALKYNLDLTVLDETIVDGHKLSDVIMVGIVEGGITSDNRNIVIGQVKTWTKLSDFSLNMNGKELAAKTDDAKFGIVLYWQPNANEIDNLYNMNNGRTDVLKLDIGVNLFATQVEAESDSFGPDYDADAELCNFIVSSEAELLAALAEAKNGDVIGIKGNVTWTTGAQHGSTPFSDTLSLITLVGVDETATFTAVGAGVGPIGIDNGKVIFKNLKIADESVSYAEGNWEFGYLEFRGNTVFENCDIVNAIMMEGDSASFINCSFNSNKTSEYAVWVDNGDATFENCYFTGTRGVKVHEAYGSEVGTVVINNNTFAALTEKPGLAIGTVNADTTISLTNNLFAGTQPGDQNLYKYETDTDVTTFSFTDENNTVRENSKVIASAADLLAMSGKRADGEVILVADIDLGGADFNAIIVNRNTTLTFVGNGHTISNVNVVSGADDNTTGQASMFYAYPGSTLNISDLTLQDVTVKADENGTGYAAAVVGYCEGAAVLNNVDVVNATVVGVKSSGALVGHLSGSLTATGCDVIGTVTLADFAEEANGHYAGKYIGTMAGATALNNCTANVTVSGNLNAANDGAVYGRKTAAGSLTVDGATTVYQTVATAEALREVAAGNAENVIVTLATNITLGDDTAQKSMGAYFPNATNVTINGNDNTLTLKGPMTGADWHDEYYAGIIAPNATVTVKDLTIVNEKLGKDGTNISADRESVYTMVRGASVLFENVNFVGGIQVKNNTKFVSCTFVEDVLVKNDAGFATNGKFCVFIDFEYDANGVCTVDFEGCTFDASGYGCVKVAGNKGANITVNVKDCSFTNTCPSNNWSQTTPKYDVKMTGSNITVNDLGGNTWAKGFGNG